MTNTLTFQRSYKSIKNFKPVDLPDFSVVTGINGSGKTHLLNAIKDGSIKTSQSQYANNEILILDSNSIAPKDNHPFDPLEFSRYKSELFSLISSKQNSLEESIFNLATQAGIPSDAYKSIKDLYEFNNEGNSFNGQIPNIKHNIRKFANYMVEDLIRKNPDPIFIKSINKVLEEKPFVFFEKSEADFFLQADLIWQANDLFQQAFAQVFGIYRTQLQQNFLQEKFSSTSTANQDHLSNKVFEKKNGPPPWDFVNEIFQLCKLDFKIDSPPLYELTKYEPRLIKKSTNSTLKFEDLSSGEKVMMSFALCLYN